VQLFAFHVNTNAHLYQDLRAAGRATGVDAAYGRNSDRAGPPASDLSRAQIAGECGTAFLNQPFRRSIPIAQMTGLLFSVSMKIIATS
jgi:hypothetical protein